MGAYINGGINFTDVRTAMSNTMDTMLNGKIRIIDPNTRDVEWDVATNSYGETQDVTVWEGIARIQPLGSTTTSYTGFIPTSVRNVLIHIPLDDSTGLIRSGLQVQVVDDGFGNDAALNDLMFTIESAVNSSYAWVRTLRCIADVKNEANAVF